MKVKDIVKYLISAAVAVVLLYFSFRGVKWSDFMSALKCCRWEWIGVAMVAGVISFWLRALRWRKLLLPIDPVTSRKVTFNAINIGYLANLVLPRIGEFVRCGFISGHSPKDREGNRAASYDKVLGTVVLERSWDVIVMVLLLALMAAAMWDKIGGFFMNRMIGPLSQRLDAGIVAVAAGACVCLAVCLLLMWKFRGRGRFLSRLYGFASGLWQGVISCFRMEKSWQFMIYTALVWIMYWLMSFSVLLSVQGADLSSLSPEFSGAVSRLSELGVWDALFLMLAGSLSSLVPVPGGFGAFHYIVATALSTVYGVPFGVGIVFATLSHESQVITQIVCGFCSYVSESVSRK